MKIYARVLAVVFLVCAILCNPVCLSAAEKLATNSSVKYDVYFSGGNDAVNVVRNVKVLEPSTFYGQEFLVIETTDLRSDKGYILMSSVVAIVPNGLAVAAVGNQ